MDFAHTLQLVSVMSVGNHGIVRLAKYCVILEKNANYRTPLKMQIRRTIVGFTLVIVCGKLKRLSPKKFLILIKQSLDYCSDDFRSNEANLRFPNNFILGGGIFYPKKWVLQNVS